MNLCLPGRVSFRILSSPTPIQDVPPQSNFISHRKKWTHLSVNGDFNDAELTAVAFDLFVMELRMRVNQPIQLLLQAVIINMRGHSLRFGASVQQPLGSDHDVGWLVPWGIRHGNDVLGELSPLAWLVFWRRAGEVVMLQLEIQCSQLGTLEKL